MSSENLKLDEGSQTNVEGTTLEDFLNKFNSSSRYVNSIDPKTTFDTTITFFPGSTSTTDTGIVSTITKALGQSVDNALNNVTGGLWDNIASTNYKAAKKYDANKSFVSYMLEANLLKTSTGLESWGTSTDPIELTLGPYVQEITIPHIEMQDGGRQSTMLGDFINNGTYVKPDVNQLIMSVINTKAALHERIFYPWMKEVTLPYWSYAEQPYTTATITIDFSKHADVRYVFTGCRPSKIFSMQAKQDTSSGDNITRQVTFIFDFMFVQSPSDLGNMDSVWTKISSSAGTIFNAASKALNF